MRAGGNVTATRVRSVARVAGDPRPAATAGETIGEPVTVAHNDLIPLEAPCALAVDALPARDLRRSRPLLDLDTSVTRGLAGIVFARLAVNGGIRVVYPFLPVIARGLGVSFEVVALFVASRSLAGLAGPAIARITPPHRRRALMLLSQMVVLTGCLLIAASGGVPPTIRTTVVGLGFAATGLARPLFDLPMQTWVSAHVPEAVRGRALGLTELGWALSLAATVPVAGVLIEQVGWRSPFMLVAAMSAVGLVALARTLPRDDVAPVLRPQAEPVIHVMLSRTRKIPTGAAICLGAGLAVAAGESLLIVYGEWLTRDFGMSVAQIGASTLLIVLAELLGEGLVVAVSDRLGLCRTLFGALFVSAVMYVALGLTGYNVGFAFAVVTTLFVAFEVTVVSLIAFASTIAHRARERARLLGSLMAAVAGGNAVGAIAAPALFNRGGIALAGAAAATATALATIVVWMGSRSNPGARPLRRLR